MFRIVLNALWSKDYIVPLNRVLVDTIGCTRDEARIYIEGLSERKPLTINCDTPGKAYDLTTNLLQYGCFVEVFQTGSLTDNALFEDASPLIGDDMQEWMVVQDDRGRILKYVLEHGHGIGKFEREEVTNQVGQQLLNRGARVIDQAEMAKIAADAEASRLERVAYAKEMTARYGPQWKRILFLQRQQAAYNNPDPNPSEEE